MFISHHITKLIATEQRRLRIPTTASEQR